jgi:hypothetical protein
MPLDVKKLPIGFIRQVTKTCQKDLNKFLMIGSEVNELEFGYPLIQFSPP